MSRKRYLVVGVYLIDVSYFDLKYNILKARQNWRKKCVIPRGLDLRRKCRRKGSVFFFYTLTSQEYSRQ